VADSDVTTPSGPLAGILVADFSRVLAGPYATMLLADLGATVIKVESALGDETRHWGPPWYTDDDGHRESTYYLSINRNKRSVVLDLASEEGRTAALRLAERADLLIENFRVGSLDRLGLGYEDVHKRNPRLVYCSLTGFGAEGGARLPGYDLVVQAVSGLMSLTGPDADTPTKQGIAASDVITGLHAALGMLAALQHARTTGEGQHLQVNLLSSTLSALVNFGGAYVLAGDVSHGIGIRHPSICPYEPLRTADRPLIVAAANDGQFRRLCGVLGQPELADDPRYLRNADRVAHREELIASLEAVLCSRPADDWFEALSEAGVACGPINDVAAGVALAERLGLQPVAEAGAVRTIASPFRLSATPASYRHAPPRHGADTEDVLAWLAE
jgi:crotonobetainyl-CoA:carnitine CoA-transferase CaiB-like acyl-CoA transferase